MLMLNVFEFARGLISLRLTETEIALLSAVVLMNPSKPDNLTQSSVLREKYF